MQIAKWRRRRAILLMIMLVFMAVANGISLGAKKITLTVATNRPGNVAKVLQKIAADFMAEHPDIKVDFLAPAGEYENIMKIKMASHELPDVFATHGWAKIRYGAYLADLRKERWASQISPTIKPQITDAAGKVYVLPLDEDKAGIVYNADILKGYGVAVPTTLAQFMAACETIKTKSGGKIRPIHIGGADNWPEGQFYCYFATPLLISPKSNHQKELLDGTFSWKHFDFLPEKFLEMWRKGYINPDFVTAKYIDSAKAFAEGKAVFCFYGAFFVEQVNKINPRTHCGIMPIPAIAPGDEPTFAGGELTTWGVWKDSAHLRAAKQFVAYYARPQNIQSVAAAERVPAGLAGIEADLGELGPFYRKYAKLRILPYFDRTYLPNGMWDVIRTNAQDLAAGIVTPRQFSSNMEREYKRLKAAQGN